MLLFVLLSLFDAPPYGYQTYKVTARKPFHISLLNQVLIFILEDPPNPSVSFVAIDHLNHSHRIPMYGLSHIHFTNVTIDVSASISYLLQFWIIPAGFCPSGSYVALADRRLVVERTGNSISSDLCIFSQSGASSHDLRLISRINTPGVISFHVRPPQPFRTCHLSDRRCYFNSGLPFIVKLSNVTRSFSILFDLTVFRKDLESAECSFDRIPALTGGVVTVDSGPLNPIDIACTSMAEAVVKYITIGCGILFAIAAILFSLDILGCLDISELHVCSKEYTKFDSLKQDPYAHVLDTEDAMAADDG
jgi:hypothetical protein